MSIPQPPEEDGSAFRKAPRAPLLHRTVPIARDLRGYHTNGARQDIVAGLTVAALAIPSGMAYAQLAGLTPVIGLYALLLPVVAYALLGSSRQVAVGPEGSLSALVAAALVGVAAGTTGEAATAAAALALMVGACFLIARVLRLGFIADYLSKAVLVGYLHGVAVVLIVAQLPKLLGVDVDATDTVGQFGDALRGLGDVSWTTVLVSVVALVILFGLRFLAPKVPAALLVLVGGIAASKLLGLADDGVAVVGTVPAGLPTPDIPGLDADTWLVLAPAAVGIFLVDFADEVLTARSYASRRGETIDVNQELTAMGAANLVAGVTRGLPIGASGSRTAVNDTMGAVSQVSGLIAAVAVALVLLFLTGPIADLPTAILGAAIVAAASSLIQPAAWRRLWAADRVEAAIAAVTMGGVIITGVLQAVVFAVGLSIVDVVRRSARPHDAVLGWVPSLGRYADVAEREDAEQAPGVVVYRLDDRLFYANVSYVVARVLEAVRGSADPVNWVVFDVGGVSHVDASALSGLDELIEMLDRRDVSLALARVKLPLEDRLREAGLVDRLGRDRLYPTVRAAVEATSVPS